MRRLAAVAWILGSLSVVEAAGPWPEHPAKKCPREEYCCLHYWAPTVYRACAYWHKPGTGRYALDVAPRTPLGNQPVPFPCPGVPPAAYPYAALVPSGAIVPFPPDVNAPR